MKAVLFYESTDDVLAKAPAHFPAHLARIHECRPRLADPRVERDPRPVPR